jgi:hypothetical protein
MHLSQYPFATWQKLPTSIIWVKVQGMARWNDHGGVLFKVDKGHRKIECLHTMSPFAYKVCAPLLVIL